MLAAMRGDAGHLFAAIQRENPFAAEAARSCWRNSNGCTDKLPADADGDSLAISAPSA